ncbi:MAG: heavy metal translocating P-type ATPase metal-binding domain-containing protein [Bacteroidia bacterium]|nr:heavy metal translocating P-type ATPase metal-binding domain-containing protein [Bacteroidia bacterium]
MKIGLEAKEITCYHCGDKATVEPVVFDAHEFCCEGCSKVYQILSSNNLCDYYLIENSPGMKVPLLAGKFNYLDDELVQQKLIDFRNEQITKVTFFIPIMHCSSCIWLLEHLYKLDEAVVNSRVNFLKKHVTVTFKNDSSSLRKIVELLASIGYEPAINLNDIETEVKKSTDRKLIYRIGVAAFCFGNIMLISFPEYFGLDSFTRGAFSRFFGYLNLGLSIPVFLYSARDYFTAAFKGLRKRHIGIDVPLALGIFVLFVRSAYEVISHTGIGYFDTHAGLVFFLLIGKWFQQKTFDTLSFERDYKSYFPVAVTAVKEGKEESVPVTNLNIGDRIVIKNNELIPADSILMRGEANIDFSFVTGETSPMPKVPGELIYAGGKQLGSTIELEVVKKVSQSYLTQLWNNEQFTKENDSRIQSFQQVVSRYFTFGLLAVAFGSAAWWLIVNPSLALNAFTAVLIIACPCALALSSPFALGTAMRILGKYRFYLKSPEVVEQIAGIDTMVFDKTGTITQPAESTITYLGEVLYDEEKTWIASLVRHSVHPLSKKIKNYLGEQPLIAALNFSEFNGRGVEGTVAGNKIKVGSYAFIFPTREPIGFSGENPDVLATRVYVQINGKVPGYFQIKHSYRNGLKKVLASFDREYDLYLLSGDNESERRRLSGYFGDSDKLFFRQSPLDKLQFIERLQNEGKLVLMLGDGLNDAGALKAGNVGISVTENTAHFSPASDVIMDASMFAKLPAFIKLCKNTLRVIHGSFVISLLYNVVGLSFAVQGTLSPLIAAILMPLSSVTVIGFTTVATTVFARKGGLK